MNREDIIRMAEEAGLDPMQDTLCSFDGFEAQFTKFAQLVAAHERDACANIAEPYQHIAREIRART